MIDENKTLLIFFPGINKVFYWSNLSCFNEIFIRKYQF